jgi:hypothetical protein
VAGEALKGDELRRADGDGIDAVGCKLAEGRVCRRGAFERIVDICGKGQKSHRYSEPARE